MKKEHPCCSLFATGKIFNIKSVNNNVREGRKHITKIKIALTYSFWKMVSAYGNEHWGGCFTPREVEENARDYTAEFQACCNNSTPNENIAALCTLLAQDATEESRAFWEMIKENSEFGENYVNEIEAEFTKNS